MRQPDELADVIVVGAGPSGTATAIHLARAGVRVLLVEKAAFPREKVCGDGLTPRTVKELALLGADVAGLDWQRTRGLRMHVGRARYVLPWPELSDFPSFGLVRRRADFDQFLAGQAVDAGVTLLTGTAVQAPIQRRGRITGVVAKDGRRFEAPVVVAADGNSARLAVAMGLGRLVTRPVGVAVRTYYRSPMADEEWLDLWLEMWDGVPGRSHLLPGYGWSFPEGDGTCNVGLGLLDASRYRDMDYRELLTRWLAALPAEWGFTPANATQPVRGAALPMGFNRKPAYTRGLLLVGDAMGAVNPFNGEGISYAMESGRYAAGHILQARARGFGTRSAEQALAGYGRHLASAWGGYFRLGNLFEKIIAHPQVMKAAAHWGLPIPVVRQITHRMLSNLTDHPGHDAYDRVVNALVRLAPSA